MRDVIYSYLKKNFYPDVDFILKKYTLVNDNKSFNCDVSVMIKKDVNNNVNFYHMRYVTIPSKDIIIHERELKIKEIL